MNIHQPIGIFDSGIGGLSVLSRLMQVMPQESFLYFGDTAKLPYGSKSANTILDCVYDVTDFLVDQGIKCLVMACNTASAIALQAVQRRYPELLVVGVIEPSADSATAQSKSGNIAVLATAGTVKSGIYVDCLLELNPEARVFSQACPLLVSLVEEGQLNGRMTLHTIRDYWQQLLEQVQSQNTIIDTLILGCTHFPFLQPSVRAVIDDHITIVDSGLACALHTKSQLQAHRLHQRWGQGHVDCWVSDAPSSFMTRAKQLLPDHQFKRLRPCRAHSWRNQTLELVSAI